MANYRIISSDSHVWEPPDLWRSRMEPKFRDRAPQIVRQEDGGDYWVCEGHNLTAAGAAGSQAGVRFDEPEKLTSVDVFENVRLGGYIPEEHVKDMDIDGVDVGIIYPTAGDNAYKVEDSELLTDICRAYNDWLAEFCKPFPDRLKGVAMLNVDDVQGAVKEMERCAKMGLERALITVYPPEDRGYHLPEYDPLWAAAQDMEVPLGLHLVTNRTSPGHDISAIQKRDPVFSCNSDHWVRTSIGQMIFGGVFERYPRLHVGSVETELSWAPHFLQAMDYTYTQRPHRDMWAWFKGGMLPSDYFHRNVFMSFQEDALGVRLRDIIGVDNLLWGSDYPHQESTFPKTREILERILADCTEEEKAKIAGGNAARIYNLN